MPADLPARTPYRDLGLLFRVGTVNGLSEKELLDRFLDSRDERAFEALVSRHGPMVLRTCRSILPDPFDAEDAFQATFLVLARRASTLRNPDLLGPWLHRTARRVCTRLGKTAARRRLRERPATDTLHAAEAPAPAADRLPLPDRLAIHAAIDRLPSHYRRVILLCDLEGRSHAEAAALLDWPIGTVKGRQSRARSLLRRRLARLGLAPAASSPLLLPSPLDAALLSPALIARTARTSAAFAAGGALAAGTVPSGILALTNGVLSLMLLKTTTIGTLTALAPIVLLAGAVTAYTGQTGPGSGEAPVGDANNSGVAGVVPDPGRKPETPSLPHPGSSPTPAIPPEAEPVAELLGLWERISFKGELHRDAHGDGHRFLMELRHADEALGNVLGADGIPLIRSYLLIYPDGRRHYSEPDISLVDPTQDPGHFDFVPVELLVSEPDETAPGKRIQKGIYRLENDILVLQISYGGVPRPSDFDLSEIDVYRRVNDPELVPPDEDRTAGGGVPEAVPDPSPNPDQPASPPAGSETPAVTPPPPDPGTLPGAAPIGEESVEDELDGRWVVRNVLPLDTSADGGDLRVARGMVLDIAAGKMAPPELDRRWAEIQFRLRPGADPKQIDVTYLNDGMWGARAFDSPGTFGQNPDGIEVTERVTRLGIYRVDGPDRVTLLFSEPGAPRPATMEVTVTEKQRAIILGRVSSVGVAGAITDPSREGSGLLRDPQGSDSPPATPPPPPASEGVGAEPLAPLLGTWRRTSLNGIPTAEGEIVALELLPEDPEVARKLEGIGTLLRSTLIEGPGEDSRFGVTRDMVLVNGDGSSGHFDIPFMGLLALALGTTDRPPSVKPGIYRVEGDTLTILRSTLDSIRPARFDEPLRPGMRLETFERSSEPLPTPQPGEGAGAVPDPGPNADPPSPPPSGSAASPATHPASKPEDSDSIAPILGTWRRSSMNHIPTPEGMVAMLDIRRADPAKISGTGTPVLCTGFAGPLPGGGFLNSQSLALVLGDGQSGHFDFLSLSVFGLPGDFVPKEPANPAIYRIEGDTLTLFSGPSRPTRFDQELTPDMKLEVYERTTDPLPTPASTQAPGHSYGLAPGAVPGDGKAGDVATTPDSDSEQSSPAATGPGNSAAKPPATPDLATLERYREELEVRRAQLVDQAAGLRPELELLGIEQEALATSLRDLLSELQAMERAIKSIDDPLPENRDRLNRLSHETHDLRLEYLQLSRELEEKRLQARSLDSKLDQLDDLRAKVDRALSPVPDRAGPRLDEIEAKLDRLTRLIESLADEGD